MTIYIECAMQTHRRADVAFRPLTAAEEDAGYLDCKPGFLAEFYAGAGFEEVAQKAATINRGAACYLAEVVLMRRAL